MFTYIMIGVAVLLLATTCYLAGYLRSQSIALEQVRDENYGLVRENSSLREKVAAHETSLIMLMHEVQAAS